MSGGGGYLQPMGADLILVIVIEGKDIAYDNGSLSLSLPFPSAFLDIFALLSFHFLPNATINNYENLKYRYKENPGLISWLTVRIILLTDFT